MRALIETVRIRSYPSCLLMQTNWEYLIISIALRSSIRIVYSLDWIFHPLIKQATLTSFRWEIHYFYTLQIDEILQDICQKKKIFNLTGIGKDTHPLKLNEQQAYYIKHIRICIRKLF